MAKYNNVVVKDNSANLTKKNDIMQNIKKEILNQKNAKR